MSRKSPLLIFAIALFYLTTPTIAQAQLINIGNDAFTKCFIENTPKGAVLKAKLELDKDEQALYFDNKNNIRKYISNFEYYESRFLVAAGYDISGKLSAIIFRIAIPEGASCYGTASVSYSCSNNPMFNYDVHWLEENEVWKRDVSAEPSNSFPTAIAENLIFMTTST